jgi:hypothetical protein
MWRARAFLGLAFQLNLDDPRACGKLRRRKRSRNSLPSLNSGTRLSVRMGKRLLMGPLLGTPDLTVLTLSEFSDQAYRIGRAVELPLLVDADHGYALNVMCTVEGLEKYAAEREPLPPSHCSGRLRRVHFPAAA